MTNEIPEEAKRWTAKRRQALVLQIVRGERTAVEAARKLLYLATVNVTREWTGPLREWSKILGQLAIHFEDRMQIP